MDPEGSLYWQQNGAAATAADPYIMPTGHSSNCSRKMVFSVSGTELHQYPSPSPIQRMEQTGQARSRPKDVLPHFKYKEQPEA